MYILHVIFIFNYLDYSQVDFENGDLKDCYWDCVD
jgi:hypothetical protein